MSAVHAGVRAGLASLTKGGAQPGYLILDDGWQMTDLDPEYQHLGNHVMNVSPQVPSWAKALCWMHQRPILHGWCIS